MKQQVSKRFLLALAALILAVSTGVVLTPALAQAQPWYCNWFHIGCPAAGPTLSATDVTSTTANLSWQPTNATVTQVGRGGHDSNGVPPWTGVPSQLPFRDLIPNTDYDLWANVNGAVLTVKVHTLPRT